MSNFQQSDQITFIVRLKLSDKTLNMVNALASHSMALFIGLFANSIWRGFLTRFHLFIISSHASQENWGETASDKL